MKKSIQLLLKLVISIGILVWVLSTSNIDVRDLTFDSLQLKWILPVAFFASSQVLFQALRWRTLYGADEVPAYREFVKFILLGYFYSILLPWSLGGDAIKAVAFGKRHNGMLHSSSAILFGRIFGVTSLFVIFIIARISFNYPLDEMITLSIIIGLLLISVGLMLFFITPLTFFKRFKPDSSLRKNLESITSLPKEKWILGALFSFVIQFTILSMVYSSFKLIGAEINYSHIIFYLPITTILLFLPISFSGLGVREASLVYFLAPIGISSTECLESSIITYIVLVCLAVIGAVIFVFTRQRNEETISSNNVM